MAIEQQKRVRESCTQSNHDYYIMTRDITRLRRIVENEEIRHDDNDAISVRVWATRLQQDGGEATLKDRLDPPPPGSGLSPDSFVLCIQTQFQKEQFQMLGSHFLSIDATHNTTQYAGLQLFTLLVRDMWGHGTLCGIFPLLDIYSFPFGRCSRRVDGVVKRHGSDNIFLPQFRKSAEPGDRACDRYERSRQSTNECRSGRVPGVHSPFVLVACAPRDADALPHGRVPTTLGTRP
jgi:hypothetical protein